MKVDFKDYVAAFEPAKEMRLREQREAFNEILEPLRLVGMVQSYLNDERQVPRPTEPRAYYVIAAETTQLAIGIHESLAQGVAFAAGGNFRTLFELLISVKLISDEKSQDRSDLFMDFSKVLRRHHLQEASKANLPDDPTIDPKAVESEFQTVKGRYASNPTYWWSSLMWKTSSDAKSRRPIGTAGACAFLDDCKVPTGIRGFNTFSELNVRWYGTFSTLAHATVQGAMAMVVHGQKAMAWQLDANLTRIAPLALAACAEIIPLCEEGLGHPRAGWARMYMRDLRDRSIQAQNQFESRP